MQSSELRRRFLSFFEEHEHRVRESASLLPAEPGLLFNIAGMVPFIPYFTGEDEPPAPRLTTAQKCLRTEDIDRVGSTRRHLTFFEMLGNFSFGDYFKEEAIRLAWDFMTEHVGLEADRLWISVFGGDEDRGLKPDLEAERLWREAAGVPEERILRFGPRENFWTMAETGPCGPCSEILYDQEGGATPDEARGIIEADGDRVLELWNLVFMQFDRDTAGEMTPLPQKNIDTGLGLERLAAVTQNASSNFDTDLFLPLVNRTRERAGLPPVGEAEGWSTHDAGYGPERVPVFPDRGIEGEEAWQHVRASRIVADHVRAASFLLAEGLLPGNEGRGYVLRRLIRRALRWGRRLGVHEPFLHELVPVVVDVMGEHYGELAEQQATVRESMQREEEQFLRTLDEGLQKLQVRLEELREAGSDGPAPMPGEEIFDLYETYGFPTEITREILEDAGIDYAEEEIEAARRAHREKSRSEMREDGEDLTEVLAGVPGTDFVGYDVLEAEAEVVALLDAQGDPVERLEPGEEGYVVLEQSPFYPEGGGQVGDRGTIGGFAVEDTQSHGEHIVHEGAAGDPLEVGRAVHACVDEAARRGAMRHHTATHLLQAALRAELGEGVMQDGSLVSPDTLRFDFTHPEPVDGPALERVEETVNDWIYRELPIRAEVMDREEAKRRGALAFFGEHYGDRVRVVEMGDVSLELCGGTHLDSTGEVGVFAITDETSVAAGVRRIQALAGEPAYRYLDDQRDRLNEVVRRLGVQRPRDVPRRLEEMQRRLDDYEEQLDRLRRQVGADRAARLAEEAEDVDGLAVVVETFEGTAPDTLKTMLDEVRARLERGVVLFVNRTDDAVQLLLGVADGEVEGVHAGEWVSELGEMLGGGGGGRPDFAEAGGSDPGRIPEVLDRFRAMVRERNASVSGH